MALDLAEGIEDLVSDVAGQLLRQERPQATRLYDTLYAGAEDQEVLDATQRLWNKLVLRRGIKLLKDITEAQVSAYRDEYGEEPV
jgi:hypothetical protein